ncbi:hypothetical protein GCM10007859_28950 [Brevundimonas denitrificans]|uniref:Uncharacterized protein n=1 Tax=Brevundimonas denitrificans TaxID=1443434 RepID=A0ABQ6BLE2_9CAUL|nr:hypothetical protein GCM10007859_28950 [Brevundimonas denitrificans]
MLGQGLEQGQGVLHADLVDKIGNCDGQKACSYGLFVNAPLLTAGKGIGQFLCDAVDPLSIAHVWSPLWSGTGDRFVAVHMLKG